MKKIIGFHHSNNLDYLRDRVRKHLVLAPEWWVEIDLEDYKVIAMDAHRISRVVQSYNH